MKIDAMSAAQSFLATRYPHAEVAYLGGSVTTSAATATSDLDILVLMGPDQDELSYVETTTHEGWLVEAFVYGPAAAKAWLERGRAQRRPVLDSLAAWGVPLTTNAPTTAWAERAREVLDAGPGPPEADDVNLRRYSLSAVIDDLEGGADDPAEVYMLTATAFREAAELALLINARWLGSGKWLVRQLRDCPDHGLLEWAVDNHDCSQLISSCRAVLDDSGGYLQDGFVRGHRPGS